MKKINSLDYILELDYWIKPRWNCYEYYLKEGHSVNIPILNGSLEEIRTEIEVNNYRPFSMTELMEQAIESYKSKDYSFGIQSWHRKNLNSGDLILYHPDGRVKIVPGSDSILKLNLEEITYDGNNLILQPGTFNKFEGHEFDKKYVDAFANRPMKKQHVCFNPFWNAITDGDEDLLSMFTHTMFPKITDAYTNFMYKDAEMMEFNLRKSTENETAGFVTMNYDAQFKSLSAYNYFGEKFENLPVYTQDIDKGRLVLHK